MTYGIDKRCGKCGETKPVSEFYRKRDGHYTSYCRSCNAEVSKAYLRKRYAEDAEFRERTKARSKQWEITNRERVRERSRRNYDPVAAREARRLAREANPGAHADHHRSSRYDISRAEFDAMIERQDRRCAICREPFATTPRIDHIKGTRTVRGLLCDLCNRGLGYFRHDPEILRAAATYLMPFQIVACSEPSSNVGS